MTDYFVMESALSIENVHKNVGQPFKIVEVAEVTILLQSDSVDVEVRDDPEREEA